MMRVAQTDVGLGTAYERLAIYELFDRWLAPRGVLRACEGPIDGMAGIAGIHLVGQAKQGTRVRVELPDPAALEVVRGVYRHLGIEDRLEAKVADVGAEADGGFDLVLLYNALALATDWRAYLRRQLRRSSRWAIVSVTNAISYGVWIRRLQRVVESGPHNELFDHESCHPDIVEFELRQYGRIVAHEYLDCPWWPDLFVETGDSLLEGTLKRLPLVGAWAQRRRSAEQTAGFLYGPEDFPLLPDHPRHGEFRRALRKHPVFDGRGELLGKAFGHHHAYLLELE